MIKSKKMLVAIVLAIALIGGFIVASNGMTGKENAVEEAYAKVDTQLQRRNDLIPNLVEVTKGYAEHEAGVFTEIAKARSAMASAAKSGNMADISAANTNLSTALSRLMVLQETYPDLKADKQFATLSDELAGTENRIAVARDDYNTTVRTYNNAVSMFPNSMIAGMQGKHKKDYFKADEAAKDAPKVSFGTSSN